MKKMEAYRWLSEQSRELSFLANVILNQHPNPAKKLKGLVKMVKKGHEFRIADFHIDILIMDGRRIPWDALDKWSEMKMYSRPPRGREDDPQCLKCSVKPAKRDCNMCHELSDVPPGVGRI